MHDTHEFHTKLDDCCLIQGLNDHELEDLLKRVSLVEFAEGESIIEEGSESHEIWILLSGRCEVLKTGAKGENRLATIEAGHIIGEMSFFDQSSHSATVKAIEDIKTLKLTYEAFFQLREENHIASDKIARNVIHILSERLRKMDEWTCKLVDTDCNQKKHDEWYEFRSKLYTNLYD